MTRRTALLALGSLLALSAAAGAEESTPEVGFYINFYNGPIAEATIWVDPDAPVDGISLSSADWGCGFEDPVETQPGVWVATGHADSAYYCWTVHLSVAFGGGGGGGSDSFCKFVGLEKASFTGSSHTDSYAWEQGPYSAESAGAEGHVCSNGEIRMTGNAAIHGDALTDDYVKRSGNAYLTGYIEPLPQPLSHQAVDAGNAAEVNDNGGIPFSSHGKLPLRDGRFKLSGGESVELAPGTYYFSELHLSGGSTLRITGPTEIHVAGDFKLSGGSIANESRDPSELKIFLTGGTAKLSAHSALYAMIYGPESKVEFTGGSDFFGTVVGRQLEASGSAGLHAVSGSGGDGGEPVTVERVFYNTAT